MAADKHHNTPRDFIRAKICQNRNGNISTVQFCAYCNSRRRRSRRRGHARNSIMGLVWIDRDFGIVICTVCADNRNRRSCP